MLGVCVCVCTCVCVHVCVHRFMKDRARYKYIWQGALELAMRHEPERMMFYWGMQVSIASLVAACMRMLSIRRHALHSQGLWP